jgi:hypothetical protein
MEWLCSSLHPPRAPRPHNVHISSHEMSEFTDRSVNVISEWNWPTFGDSILAELWKDLKESQLKQIKMLQAIC